MTKQVLRNMNPIDLDSVRTVTLLFSDGDMMPLGGMTALCQLHRTDRCTVDFICDASGRFGPVALIEFGVRLTQYGVGAPKPKASPERARGQKRAKRTTAPRKK